MNYVPLKERKKQTQNKITDVERKAIAVSDSVKMKHTSTRGTLANAGAVVSYSSTINEGDITSNNTNEINTSGDQSLESLIEMVNKVMQAYAEPPEEAEA